MLHLYQNARPAQKPTRAEIIEAPIVPEPSAAYSEFGLDTKTGRIISHARPPSSAPRTPKAIGAKIDSHNAEVLFFTNRNRGFIADHDDFNRHDTHVNHQLRRLSDLVGWEPL